MPQHKALLIGASEYDDQRIQNLPFVPDDLQRVQNNLLDRGFQSAEIVESKRGITPNTVNGRVRAFLREAGPGDTLFVLLSGHGQHFEGKDYLIPEDATFDVQVFADSCIEIGWERELEDSPAGHVVFLIDACREGIDRDTMATPGVQPWSRRKTAHALRRKVAYVYACSAPEFALFVRESDTVQAGTRAGTRPGESFSLFSRAVADTISGDPHAIRLREFVQRVQARVGELHRAYGKTRAPQTVALVTDTDATPGSGDFPVLPGPDRRTEAHPWIRAAERHPVWQHTPEGTARETLQRVCAELAGRLVDTYETAARDLRGEGQGRPENPWHDGELAQRTHARLGFLVNQLPDGVTLSPTEAALAVLLPLVEQTFWAQEAAQRTVLITGDTTTGPDKSRFRKFAQRFPRLKRRLLTLERNKVTDGPVDDIHWWLFHRWLIQQPQLYADEAFKSLLGSVTSTPDTPPWVADALSPERLMRLVRDHRTAPFAVRNTAVPAAGTHGVLQEDRDVLAASTSDEHKVRNTLVAALTKAAAAMAVDPVDLPEIVVEHIGTPDNVDLEALLVTVQRSDWRESGTGRSLNAVCAHPAVQIALREHAARVDELLRDINRAQHPDLAPLLSLPPYADGGRVQLSGNTPDELSEAIRFQLAEDRVQELLMGEQLYGERELAVRELYQNALDAVRYRDCRTQYLHRTGGPASPWDAWEGRITFTQGVGPDGSPYLECQDNGIGMGVTELRGVFSQGGARFVDLPEYVEEQAEWSELPEPKLTLHPNSRFGIGVLSYFMLADEIVVRTCRMGRDGRPGHLLQVTIAGPGNLFRVEDLGPGEDAGTSVRLLLSRSGASVSCVEALQRVLWVAPYRTVAAHGSRRHEWDAGALSRKALELEITARNQHHAAHDAVCIPSDIPDIWWIEHPGVVLADGLFAEMDGDTKGQRPFGAIVNLHGDKAPDLTVDRTTVRAFDEDYVVKLMEAAAGSLTDPELALPTAKWLDDLSEWSVWFSDCVAAHAERVDLPWQLGDVSLPYSQVGFFPPDRVLLPLVTGRYPDGGRRAVTWYFHNMPEEVLRWRLRTLYGAGLGGPVSQPTADTPALCARPSDLVLLTYRPNGLPRSWDKGFANWLQRPEKIEDYVARPSPALVKTGLLSLTKLFPWRDPGTTVDTAEIFHLSDLTRRQPAEIAERLTLLGYSCEPLGSCVAVQATDLPLLRPLGNLYGWLTPGATLSAAQICVSAAQASCTTPQAADRLRELGFTVPVEYPIRDDWEDEELAVIKCLWWNHATERAPEAAQQISLAQLAAVAQRTGSTLRQITLLLQELGFLLPPDASSLPELTDDDRALIAFDWRNPPVDEAVPRFYVTAVARRVGRPVDAVADRLRELGFSVPSVPDDERLPSREDVSLQMEVLYKRGPLPLYAVAEGARVTKTSIEETIARLERLGHTFEFDTDIASHFTDQDPDLLSPWNTCTPDGFGPVTPPELRAAALHIKRDESKLATTLTGLGYEVVPPSQEWALERRLEEDLHRELSHPSLIPTAVPGDEPSVSLVTLVVVALRSGRTLREVASLATEMDIRHELETWFSPPRAEPVDASAAATPPP